MAFFSKSLRNWTKKHDFIEGLTEWSPTEYAEFTELSAVDFLPQIALTEVRLPSRGCTCLKCTKQTKSIFSHKLHRWFECVGMKAD